MTAATLRRRGGQLARDGGLVMVVGTAAGAVGAYAFQLMGSRALGPTSFAPITVLWTLQVLVLSVVLIPVEQLVTRRLELSGGTTAGLRRQASTLVLLLLGCVGGVWALAWSFRSQFLGGDVTYVLAAGLLVVGYCLFAVARGCLAGRHRYHAYGLATAGEAMLRLALGGAALLMAVDGRLLAVAMVVAPLAVLATRPHRRPRRLLVATPDPQPQSRVRQFLGPLIASNALAQAVLVSPPLVVAALGGTAAAVSSVFLTFSLLRGPLWIVQSALARALPPFTALAAAGNHHQLRVWVKRFTAGGIVLAMLAWVGGLWLGSPIVGMLFGAEFTPRPVVAALAAGGTVLAAVMLCNAQLLVAQARTAHLVRSWFVAAVVTVVVTVLVPADPAIRVAWGFATGELTAVAVVTWLAVSSKAATAETEPVRQRRAA